jgi:riboflavin biosynthesis pyrimidine reductase
VRRVLVAQGLRVLFVEGGGVTVSRFLAQGLLDRLHVALAPVLIGEGRRGVHLPASGRMADCLRPAGRVVRLGEDMLWDFDLSGAGGRHGDQVDVPDTQARSFEGGGA